MYRGLLLAVLIGVSAASTQTVSSVEKSGSYLTYPNLVASWYFQWDLAYETLYENGAVDKGWQKEGYGFHTWSNVSYQFTIELFQSYQYSCQFTLGLFDIAPMKASIVYYRPEFTLSQVENFWDIRFMGKYTFKLLWLQMDTVENTKTFKSSFVDWFKKIGNTDFLPMPHTKSDLYYNLDYRRSYTNPDYNFDLLSLFFDDSQRRFFGSDLLWFDIHALNPDQSQYFTTKDPYAVEPDNDTPVNPGPQPEPEPTQK